MTTEALPQDIATSPEAQVRALFERLLNCWNQRDAAGMAAIFAENGNTVGFDGSPLDGRAEIASVIAGIFAQHQTAAYVANVREVRFLTPDVALVRAVAGMVPPGKKELNPAVNAIQSLVAVRRDAGWEIALFQNTPAQFHGRPELAQKLTEELSELIK